jgi:hypothetical protein
VPERHKKFLKKIRPSTQPQAIPAAISGGLAQCASIFFVPTGPGRTSEQPLVRQASGNKNHCIYCVFLEVPCPAAVELLEFELKLTLIFRKR